MPKAPNGAPVLTRELRVCETFGKLRDTVAGACRDYSREVTLELAEAFEEFAKQESRKERKTRISFADQKLVSLPLTVIEGALRVAMGALPLNSG